MTMLTIDDEPVDRAQFVQHHRSGSTSAEKLMLVVASALFDIDVTVLRYNDKIDSEVYIFCFVSVARFARLLL
jgi:hypothetical protein